MSMLREMLKKTPLGASIAARRHNFYDRYRQLTPDGKHETIREYGSRFGTKTLIETGTYLGDMLMANVDHFDRLVSIELGPELYEKASERFATISKVLLKCGDSGEILAEILHDIDAPCLFWLDAHYSRGITAKGSTETPIIRELGLILQHSVKDHLILIDDARCFNGKDDYPTIREIELLLVQSKTYRPIEIKDDIIRIAPPLPYSAWTLKKIHRWYQNGGLSY